MAVFVPAPIRQDTDLTNKVARVKCKVPRYSEVAVLSWGKASLKKRMRCYPRREKASSHFF